MLHRLAPPYLTDLVRVADLPGRRRLRSSSSHQLVTGSRVAVYLLTQTENSWPTVLKFVEIREFYQLFKIRKKAFLRILINAVFNFDIVKLVKIRKKSFLRILVTYCNS